MKNRYLTSVLPMMKNLYNLNIDSAIPLQFSCKHQINYHNTDCIKQKKIPSSNIQELLHAGVQNTYLFTILYSDVLYAHKICLR